MFVLVTVQVLLKAHSSFDICARISGERPINIWASRATTRAFMVYSSSCLALQNWVQIGLSNQFSKIPNKTDNFQYL